MHTAAQDAAVADVKALLAKGDCEVDAKDNLDQTPLLLAMRMKAESKEQADAYLEIAKLLVAAGASVASRDKYGDNIIHLAAMRTGDEFATPEMMKMVIDGGANINEKCGNFGNTALHWVTLVGGSNRQDSIVADAETNTKTNATCAAEVARYLLEKGARTNLKNRQKKFVLDYAKQYENKTVEKLIESAQAA